VAEEASSGRRASRSAALRREWISPHEAIACAIPATSNPDHLVENMGALRGPLPDREMRRRVRRMESTTGFDRIGEMPWYPCESYPGPIARAQAQVRARS